MHGEKSSKGVIVLGASGHAKVCIELLIAAGRRVAYCVGDETSGDFCLAVPVIKGDEHLKRLRNENFTQAFVAIGLNSLREKLADTVLAMGFELVNAISPYAIVSPSARLGKGIAIMPGAIINAETSIADFSIINTGATVDHDCLIGQAVHIAPQCALAGQVMVGKYSFLGIGSKVIPKIMIGENVTVGAGSIVISDVKNNARIAGVPATLIKVKESIGF